MFAYVLALFISIQSAGKPASQDEIKDALAHAEALYYEAKFSDSIQLLSRVDEALRGKPDRKSDRISVYLQLSLAHIGLDDNSAAKAFLMEIYALDPDYSLDTQQFSPKVITMFGEAKTLQQEVRCQAAVGDARKHLVAGDTVALLNLLGSMKSKCTDLAEFEPDTAGLLYKKGLAEFKLGEFSGARQSLRAALKLSPKHEMAAQYLDLIESQLQVSQDRILLQWQKNFDSHHLTEAAAGYRQIVSLNLGSNAPILGHVTGEYRKALSTLVEASNRACPAGTIAEINAIRTQITDLLPEPSFGEDIRARLTACTRTEERTAPTTVVHLDSSRTEEKPEAKPIADASCFQMTAQAAMTRLKTRVEPVINREMRARLHASQTTVRVKARIDTNGNVSVSGTEGSNFTLNNSVRIALEQWKFSPAVGVNGPRCVDTEIQIAIGQ